jgi:hypothetical protein
MNVHLFFDVFIEDAPLGIYLRGDKRRFATDYKIRMSTPSYKFQTKFDITRYTLASYADVPWKSATIRIECQNPLHHQIYDEISKQFKGAHVYKERSDTTTKYSTALNSLEVNDSSWIFFSPNNDHPMIGDFALLSKVIKDADEAKVRTRANVVSIPYSHFTETMNFFSPSQHEWGAYGGVFPKLLYETEYSYIIKLNKLLIDSLHIYQLKDLKWIFGQSNISSRVIRPEDTEFYLSNLKSHVMVLPKKEICRHYDGYMHIANKVPPLFIPDGFFEHNIKIRYGYNDIITGYTNINPLAKEFSYQSDKGADMKITLDDIPSFWRSRISAININSDLRTTIEKDKLPYYKDLYNPWHHKMKLYNYFRSVRKLIRSRN